MQNARETFMASLGSVNTFRTWQQKPYLPHPKTPAIPIAQTMAQGTAVAAFEASSLMWTLESKEPVHRGLR
jgi:hypothetical protein